MRKKNARLICAAGMFDHVNLYGSLPSTISIADPKLETGVRPSIQTGNSKPGSGLRFCDSSPGQCGAIDISLLWSESLNVMRIGSFFS